MQEQIGSLRNCQGFKKKVQSEMHHKRCHTVYATLLATTIIVRFYIQYNTSYEPIIIVTIAQLWAHPLDSVL